MARRGGSEQPTSPQTGGGREKCKDNCFEIISHQIEDKMWLLFREKSVVEKDLCLANIFERQGISNLEKLAL